MTATAERPRLLTLPTDTAAWRVPATTPLAPWCQLRPATWWEIDNRHADRAIALCGACPFADACAKTQPQPGLIQHGQPYYQSPRPGAPLRRLRVCPTCDRPVVPTAGERARCWCDRPDVCHDQIAAMVAVSTPFTEIGRVLGINGRTVRSYWHRVTTQRSDTRRSAE